MISYILQAIILSYLASVAFDVVHFSLHAFARSKIKLLQKIGSLHAAHHEFLGLDLKYNEAFQAKNIFWHLVPEYLTQMVALLILLPFLSGIPIALAAGGLTVAFIATLVMRGKDKHHQEVTRLFAPRSGLMVCPQYHAFHHRYPDRYHSSLIKIFDWIMGTGTQLEGKKIAMTGSRGAFGGAIKELLEKERVAEINCLEFGRDYTPDNYDKCLEALKHADILVLCHGSKKSPMQANCESFKELMKRFCDFHKDDFVPPEIWAVGSEIECHPAFSLEMKSYKASKDAFARIAAEYYRNPAVIYRHIVPAAFSSQMGPALMSAKTAAKIALFFIRRGFCYVPVTYTGIAVFNYFKFRLPLTTTAINDIGP